MAMRPRSRKQAKASYKAEMALQLDAAAASAEREAYICDLMGIIQAPDDVMTDTVKIALRKLSLEDVQALHALLYYTDTH